MQVVAGSDGEPRPVRGSGAFILKSSSTVTSSFTTSVVEVLDCPWLAGFSVATAGTGTNPTLTVAFQEGPTTDSFVNVGFVTLTSVTLSAKISYPTGNGRYVRATAGSLGGTNPTFSAVQIIVIGKN